MNLPLAMSTGSEVVLAVWALLLIGATIHWLRGQGAPARAVSRPARVAPSGIPQAILDHFLLKERRAEREQAGREAPVEAPALRQVA